MTFFGLFGKKLPYVQLAAFCDSVSFGSDGVPSINRMFDALTVPVHVPAPQAITVLVNAAISLKSGPVKGIRKITIVAYSPSGKKLGTPYTINKTFDGGHYHVFLPVQIQLELAGEGTYWFDVCVGGNVLTRMPLHISFPVSAPIKKKSSRREK
jgi:hypothetical protein